MPLEHYECGKQPLRLMVPVVVGAHGSIRRRGFRGRCSFRFLCCGFGMECFYKHKVELESTAKEESRSSLRSE